ncbi:MAG: hypothetical protein ACP5QA_16845 [Phycisphaerae bacterium]
MMESDFCPPAMPPAIDDDTSNLAPHRNEVQQGPETHRKRLHVVGTEY